MSTAGQQIYDQITAGLWSVLGRYRSQAAAKLGSLHPDSAFAGTVLEGLVLETLRADDIASDDAGVSALINGFIKVLPNPAPGVPVTLHGYLPAEPGQPLGLALVVAPAPGIFFVAALTGDGPNGIAIEFSAIGAASAVLQLAAGWSINIHSNAGGRLRFPHGSVASLPDAGPSLTVQLTLSYTGTPITLGADAGPHITFSNFSVGFESAIDADGNPKVVWDIKLPQANLSLIADVVAALLGNSVTIPIDLNLVADPDLGIGVRGAGLRASLPAHLNLPGVDISAVDLEVSTSAGDVQFAFGIGFTASLPGFPLLSVSVTGLGASFPVSTGIAKLGVNPPVRPTPPSGLGLDLRLPVVSGGGFLQSTGQGGYAGVLELNLLAITIEAFGLLQLPVQGKPLSFIAIICVEFPFPGIELGYGFALAGVGGIVGINRRLDQAALNGAISDGSATRLLFPANAAANGPAIVATLGRVFPEARDHIVVGPVLKITWGGRIVSMVVAVVVDLPNPVQLTVLGRLIVGMPDPEVPLVHLQATFVGAFELSPTPSVSLRASLEGSNLGGMPLSGDIYYLLRGGDDPEFVFTAGGFHPRYVPPQGVPPGLQRLQLAMTPPGVPGISADGYFAITTNTVQFGATLHLNDEIAGCGVTGWFGFDALIKWDPVFSFSVGCSGGVAVQVFGETLMGVSFNMLLEGPAPWHVQGTGSVRLFLFHASLDFSHTWGPSASEDHAKEPDLGEALKATLALPAAWVGTPPTGESAGVSLSASARGLVSEGHTVHPLGSVTARQRAVPFGITISRFQQRLITPQTWSIESFSEGLGPGRAPGEPTRDFFPTGELINLTEDEKFTKPAFEKWVSGAALIGAVETHSKPRLWDTDYQKPLLIPDFTPVTGPRLALFSSAHEAFLAVDDVHLVPALWHPPDLEVVTILPSQPVTIATTDKMSPQAGFISSASFTETLQDAQTQFGALGHAAALQMVESWELPK